MKKRALIFLLFACPIVFAAVSIPPYSVEKSVNSPIKYAAVQTANSCYINASGYQDALQSQAALEARKVWSKLLYVDHVTSIGHAVCDFKYQDHWKVYDSNKGTFDLGPVTKELTPQEIAELISDTYKNAHWYE